MSATIGAGPECTLTKIGTTLARAGRHPRRTSARSLVVFRKEEFLPVLAIALAAPHRIKATLIEGAIRGNHEERIGVFGRKSTDGSCQCLFRARQPELGERPLRLNNERLDRGLSGESAAVLIGASVTASGVDEGGVSSGALSLSLSDSLNTCIVPKGAKSGEQGRSHGDARRGKKHAAPSVWLRSQETCDCPSPLLERHTPKAWSIGSSTANPSGHLRSNNALESTAERFAAIAHHGQIPRVANCYQRGSTCTE
eukprot:scaffold19367_cov33-Tisochrysis_lutea.AAC.2